MIVTTVETRLVLRAPPGISYENPFTAYTHPDGGELLQFINASKRSDTFEWCFQRRSVDHGRTWTEPEVLMRAHEEGDLFTDYGLPAFFRDPETDVLVGTFNTHQQLKRSVYSTFANMRTLIRYSRDGGATWTPLEPLIQRGDGYDEKRWALGVVDGRNGAVSTTPGIIRHRGRFLLPLCSQAVAPDGSFYDPLEAFGFFECMIMVGEWDASRTSISWDCRQRIRVDPHDSSRGLMEPTLAELSDGRVLLVMRGSNARIPERPGVKWFSLSDDGGDTWSNPAPLTYDDGGTMFSSSTYSMLIRHSNGKLYWVGNIAAENPQGNSPRYPLHVAEIDEGTPAPIASNDNGTAATIAPTNDGGPAPMAVTKKVPAKRGAATKSGAVSVRRDSVRIIADRLEGDWHRVQLSNFWVYEDRETRELVVVLGKFPEVSEEDWTSHLYEYRVRA